MARRFFRRASRQQASSPSPIVHELAELSRLTASRPEVASLVPTYSRLLSALFESDPSESAAALPTLELARTRLASGQSILTGPSFASQQDRLAMLWRKVCECLHEESSGAAARELTLAVESGRIVPSRLAEQWLSSDARSASTRMDADSVVVDGVAGEGAAGEGAVGAGFDDVPWSDVRALGLDDLLARTVLALSLLPLMSAWCRSYQGLFDQVAWGRGRCPFCAAWPCLAEFRGLIPARRLRCARCAADWPHARVMCHVCGNRDTQTLGQLHIEGQSSEFRVDTCNRCQAYLKTVPRLAASSPAGLLVAGLETMPLDLIAVERGYRQPA